MILADFILSHDADDLASLALARGRYGAEVPDFDLALTTLEVRRKLRDKVPEWYAVPSLVYPLRVSGEQCSSSATARYKASVALTASQQALWAENACRACVAMAEGIPPETVASRPLPSTSSTGPSLLQGRGWPWVSGGKPSAIADLTGGLGVDSWAFAQVFDQVLYNEMRPELADAAAHNFRELGAANITVRNYALVPSSLIPGSLVPSSLIPGSDPGSPVASVSQILDGFRPSVIFLDPARRAADGRKVFRLEDCQPDVLQLLPELLDACPKLLLKLSPMADITLVCKQLGCVREVHVVSADGECKELLLLLERGWTGPHTLTIVEDGAVMGLGAEAPEPSLCDPSHALPLRCRLWAPPSYRAEGGHGFGSLCPQSIKILFEPGKSLLKAGAFDWPCTFGLSKLGRHTHLYVGDEVPEELRPFGKVFEIQEVVPLNNRTVKDIGKRYPKADVTARNIPLTSDQLRRKLGVSDGGSVHIFGVHIDTLSANYLLLTIPC